MRILELFKGTGSFSKVAEARGHDCFTVDLLPKMRPDLVADVMKLSLDDLSWCPFRPDIIWASPPCTKFSAIRAGINWHNGIPANRETIEAIDIVKRTVMLIYAFSSDVFFVENPRDMLRLLHIVPGRRHTVTYCSYGDKRLKPTDIWTNAIWHPKPMCRLGRNHHPEIISRTFQFKNCINKKKPIHKNWIERTPIPPALCEEMLVAAEDTISGKSKDLKSWIL